jgi:hypothetical protein
MRNRGQRTIVSNIARALVLNTKVDASYRTNKNFSLISGIAYFNTDMAIENSDERTEINYG